MTVVLESTVKSIKEWHYSVDVYSPSKLHTHGLVLQETTQSVLTRKLLVWCELSALLHSTPCSVHPSN